MPMFFCFFPPWSSIDRSIFRCGELRRIFVNKDQKAQKTQLIKETKVPFIFMVKNQYSNGFRLQRQYTANGRKSGSLTRARAEADYNMQGRIEKEYPRF